jgi:hypothetical protein
MSNNPVDTARNLDETVEGQEKENTRNATLIAFRVKVNQVLFFRRMADQFYKEGLIAAPRFALLAKACLNIIANRYAKMEEITMANYVQKRLQQVRGSNVVNYRQMQPRSQTLKQEASTLIPPELRRAPPVDKVEEPWWF